MSWLFYLGVEPSLHFYSPVLIVLSCFFRVMQRTVELSITKLISRLSGFEFQRGVRFGENARTWIWSRVIFWGRRTVCLFMYDHVPSDIILRFCVYMLCYVWHALTHARARARVHVHRGQQDTARQNKVHADMSCPILHSVSFSIHPCFLLFSLSHLPPPSGHLLQVGVLCGLADSQMLLMSQVRAERFLLHTRTRGK